MVPNWPSAKERIARLPSRPLKSPGGAGTDSDPGGGLPDADHPGGGHADHPGGGLPDADHPGDILPGDIDAGHPPVTTEGEWLLGEEVGLVADKDRLVKEEVGLLA